MMESMNAVIEFEYADLASSPASNRSSDVTNSSIMTTSADSGAKLGLSQLELNYTPSRTDDRS